MIWVSFVKWPMIFVSCNLVKLWSTDPQKNTPDPISRIHIALAGAVPSPQKLQLKRKEATKSSEQESRSSLVKIKDLDIFYESSRGLLKWSSFTAVSAAKFEIPTGKIIGLVGESGTGKTQFGKSPAEGRSFSNRKYHLLVQG